MDVQELLLGLILGHGTSIVLLDIFNGLFEAAVGPANDGGRTLYHGTGAATAETADGRVDTRFIRRRPYLYDIANGDFTLGRADETRPLGWEASEFAVFIIVDGVVAVLKISRF